MKIPKTTIDEPYIEFRFDKKGHISFTKTSNWWGGKDAGFFSTEGYEGNTCLPKDLNDFITAFKLRKIELIKDEIKTLQDKLKILNKQYLLTMKSEGLSKIELIRSFDILQRSVHDKELLENKKHKKVKK